MNSESSINESSRKKVEKAKKAKAVVYNMSRSTTSKSEGDVAQAHTMYNGQTVSVCTTAVHVQHHVHVC